METTLFEVGLRQVQVECGMASGLKGRRSCPGLRFDVRIRNVNKGEDKVEVGC